MKSGKIDDFKSIKLRAFFLCNIFCDLFCISSYFSYLPGRTNPKAAEIQVIFAKIFLLAGTTFKSSKRVCQHQLLRNDWDNIQWQPQLHQHLRFCHRKNGPFFPTIKSMSSKILICPLRMWLIVPMSNRGMVPSF